MEYTLELVIARGFSWCVETMNSHLRLIEGMRIERDRAKTEIWNVGKELAMAKDNIYALQLALHKRNGDLKICRSQAKEARREAWLKAQALKPSQPSESVT